MRKKTIKKPIGRNFRRKQRSTSIYFLVWAVFSALSLLIVLALGISHHFMLVETHKDELARDITEKGKRIERAILAEYMPEAFQGNYHEYIRYLAWMNDARVFILDTEGNVLCPASNGNEHYVFFEEVKELEKELKGGHGPVVYEGREDYVFAERVYFQGEEGYLYVYESMDIIEGVAREMTLKTVLMAAFVVLLAFAASSGISGWLTKPISEMTEKAKKFARGDFDVDFHGSDYGSEMVELASALNFARDEISKAERMQQQLISNISHDFKTPLTMIKAYSSMIVEISGDNPEKRNKHAQVIIDEADRLTSLVEDVLDISKIRSGIDEIKPSAFDLSAYVYEALGHFEYLAETKGYAIEKEIEDGVITFADETKIGRALYNLIGNAVNYTGEDKKIVARVKKISETVAEFSVSDTGEGIPPEEMDTIWERYYRSSETHKRPVKGTGLGLSIVKAILEKHSFEFGVRSEVGKGSTFYVLFPVIKELEK